MAVPTDLTRIEELETKVTFQDHLLDELNQALVVQQNDINKLTNLLESVISQVEKISANESGNDEVEVPPHY